MATVAPAALTCTVGTLTSWPGLAAGSTMATPRETQSPAAAVALYVTGGVEEKLLTELLGDPEESVRAWAIQLGLEARRPSAAVLTKLAEMARRDPSPMVRLNLASGIQRLSPSERWAVVEGLVGHGEDVKDLYLPLMNWYAVEPLFQADASQFAAELIARSRQPLVRRIRRPPDGRGAEPAGALGAAGRDGRRRRPGGRPPRHARRPGPSPARRHAGRLGPGRLQVVRQFGPAGPRNGPLSRGLV